MPTITLPTETRDISAFAPLAPAANLAKRFRPSLLRWVLAVLFVLALALGIVLWRAHSRNTVLYDTATVERGPIQAKVTATGTLNPVVNVLVSSQVSGNIKSLYADWNSRVTKGQLIALIDPEIFQAQLDQARATALSAHSSVIAAQAQLQKAKSDASSAVASEKNAQAVAAKDHANEMNAKAQWERATVLFREQVMARQDYETAEANYGAAKAQVAADQAQIEAARQSIESAQALVQVALNQLDAARAQERQSQAALRQAQINLVRTRILAPVDGTVVARRMDVGQTVASTLNPPTIFEIAQDLTKMQVDTNVDESDVGNVAVGQAATFTVGSYPSTVFHGVVADVRKAPIVTQNVVTYDVVIAVNNSSLKLLPGMTANVTILTAKQEDTLFVPNAVLRFRPSAKVLKKNGLTPPQPGLQQVYLLSDGALRSVAVHLGLTDGKSTAISSDQLHSGMQVVVRATERSAKGNSSATSAPRIPRM